MEFDALTLNGVASSCVGTTPPPATSLISDCGDFVSGPSAWPYVLVATTIADGAASQGSQTFEMNVTSLPAGGANFRVFKTTANGSNFFGNPLALTVGVNTITVPAVTFDRAVKFQFSSGDVEFDALTLNTVASSCVGSISIASADSVDFYKVLYRESGDTSWLIKQKTYDGHQTPTVRVRLQFLNPGTQYEMKIKAGYKSGCTSPFSPISYFNTLPECENIVNLSVTSPNTTKATFNWNLPSSQYSFVRIKLRVDTLNASWLKAGGFGIFYPLTSKSKNGLSPGVSYRAQARTWCDQNGGPYRSLSWTPLIFWTQPSSNARLHSNINLENIAIYPNPSRDVLNVTFTSESKQSIELRIVNLFGDITYMETLDNFEGEYTKSFNLSEYSKGVYLLELDTDLGIVNKKLILQ